MLPQVSQHFSFSEPFSQEDRQHWMAVLANASLASLEVKLSGFNDLPGYRYVRSPEIGLTMVRGRAGGTGQAFNLGEMTLTRCVVKLEPMAADQAISGFGYVAGRSQRHAELAAVCDALLQHSSWRDLIYEYVVVPLADEITAQKAKISRQTDSTQVNFFTMLRGEVS